MKYAIALLFVFVASAIPVLAAEDSEVIGAQLLLGDGWRARVTVTNDDPVNPTRFRLVIPSPWPYYLKFAMDQEPEGFDHWITLGPGESRTVLLTSSSGFTQIGWLEIAGGSFESPGNISGFLTRERLEAIYVAERITTPLVRVSDRFTVPNATEDTGIAVVNHRGYPTYFLTVTIRALDPSGRPVAEQEVVVAPHHQDARYVRQFFAGNPDWERHLAAHEGHFRGTVGVRSRAGRTFAYTHIE